MINIKTYLKVIHVRLSPDILILGCNIIRYTVIRIKLLCLLLLLSPLAKAHITLDNPVGGEQLSPGDVIVIEWHITQTHPQNNWDLYYSTDGGASWLELAIDLSVSQLSYVWTVPDLITAQAKVKIVMDNEGTLFGLYR